MLKSRRGSTLVDLMVTVFLLGVAGIIFSATLPSGIACTRKAQNYKLAVALAQNKIEQLRAMNYESLTITNLHAAGAVDSTPTSSPYSFTQVDAIANQLPSGTGTLTVQNVSGTVKMVQVTVTWQDKTGAPARTVTLTGTFADKRTRVVS